MNAGDSNNLFIAVKEALFQLKKRVLGKKSKPKAIKLRMTQSLVNRNIIYNPIMLNDFSIVCNAADRQDEWVNLLNDCGEFGSWNMEKLNQEIIANLLPHAGVFVEHKGKVVACSAICDYEEYRPYATGMYIVVLNEFRKYGLGQAMLHKWSVIASENGYNGVLIHTDHMRDSAIRLYLKMGYEPFYGLSGKSDDFWKANLTRLK